jgi:hypothetical protein
VFKVIINTRGKVNVELYYMEGLIVNGGGSKYSKK